MFNERLVEWCNTMESLLNWQLDAEFSGKSITYTNTTNLKKCLYKSRQEADTNAGRGIAMLYDRIIDRNNTSWADYVYFNELGDITPDRIAFHTKISNHLLSLINLYNDWMASLNTNKYVEDFDPSILEAINKLVISKKFHMYAYQQGITRLNHEDEFVISPIIGISPDLTAWFSHLTRQTDFIKSRGNDKVYVALFGKLDNVHPIYSSWILSFHKGDSIWLATDATIFNNPRQKHGRLNRKSVWTDAADLYEQCDLPYEIFHNLDGLRAECTSPHIANHRYIKTDIKNGIPRGFVAAQSIRLYIKSKVEDHLKESKVDFDVVVVNNYGSRAFPKFDDAIIKKNGKIIGMWVKEHDRMIIYDSDEVLFKNTDTLANGQTLFLNVLISELIQYWSTQENIPVGQLAQDFINTKLIEGTTFDPIDNDMNYWTDEAKVIFGELCETVNDVNGDTSKAVIPKSYDLVVRNRVYDSSWLGTPDRLDSYMKWMVLDDEATDFYDSMGKLRDMKEEGTKWFYEALNNKYHSILEKMKLAKNVVVSGNTWKTFADADESHVGQWISISAIKKRKTVDSYRGFGPGKSQYDEEYCINCTNFHRAREVAMINIRFYKGIMWLLDLEDRKDLHPYYRQYRSHELYPYSGNSLLDQTHPYLRVKDPLSNHKRNGISVPFYLCGTCYSKIKYKHEHYTLDAITGEETHDVPFNVNYSHVI